MKRKQVTLDNIQDLPITTFVGMCAFCALIMFGFSCCCNYCGKHHDEWEKERFEKYMEWDKYISRTGGNINWDAKDR